MLWFRILPKLLENFDWATFTRKVANKIHCGNNSVNSLSNLKINFPFFEQMKITVQQWRSQGSLLRVSSRGFSSWFSRSAKLWETAISSTPTLTNEALHTMRRKEMPDRIYWMEDFWIFWPWIFLLTSQLMCLFGKISFAAYT